MLSALPLSCRYGSNSSIAPENLHPLYLQEVLSVLFKYFSFGELKKLRTVCRTWEREAQYRILYETTKWELAPVVLAKEKEISKFLNVVGTRAPFFAFRSICVVNIVHDTRKASKLSKFIRLLIVSGHNIQTLHLNQFVIKGKRVHVTTFFNTLQRLCPNLESLILTSPIFGSNDFDASSSTELDCINPITSLISLTVKQPAQANRNECLSQSFSQSVQLLLCSLPNLENLVYYDRNVGCKFDVEALVDIIAKDNLLKVKSIQLNTQKGDLYELKHLELLSKTKLRSLQIGIDTYNLNPDLTQQQFLKFLTLQKQTLTNLHLFFNVCDISNWFTFFTPPVLPFLQELNIPYKLFSFTTLKFLPLLKKLILRGNPKSSCWIEEADNFEIPGNDLITGINRSLSHCLASWINESANFTFTNALYLRCEFVVDEEVVTFFAKKLVNVVALELGYTSEDVLLNVYQYFPSIRHLSIVCSPSLYVSSRAYLGESKAIALTESRLTGFKLDVETRNKVAEKILESSKPSILYLKDLRRLELLRFGSPMSINRIHHSIECSSGFMFGISALQNVTELVLHPFVHKRAVMSLRLMPALRVVWAVPLIIGSRESGGRSDYPTTAYWYQVLLRKRPNLTIHVTTAPTSRERDVGIVGTATRVLQVPDVYRGNATSAGLYVYLDEYYMYQDGCEVPRWEGMDLSPSSCSIS